MEVGNVLVNNFMIAGQANIPVSGRCTEDEKLIQSLRMLNGTGQLTFIDARHAFLLKKKAKADI